MRPAALLLLLAATAGAAEGGKLDRVREDVRSDPPPKQDRQPVHHADDHRAPADSCAATSLDDDGGDLVGGLVFWGLATPVWAPMSLLGDDFSPGWDASRPHQPRRDADHAVSADLLAAWQDDRDGVTHRWARLDLATRWRVGAIATMERLDEGGDHLTLGTADLAVRFAQGRGVAFHAGLGGRWLRDAVGTEGGIDALYGIEWWPVAPLALRSEISVGRVGEASVVEAWGHAGVAWRWVEVFAGGRWMRIGSVEFAGPVFGAGFHY